MKLSGPGRFHWVASGGSTAHLLTLCWPSKTATGVGRCSDGKERKSDDRLEPWQVAPHDEKEGTLKSAAWWIVFGGIIKFRWYTKCSDRRNTATKKLGTKGHSVERLALVLRKAASESVSLPHTSRFFDVATLSISKNVTGKPDPPSCTPSIRTDEIGMSLASSKCEVESTKGVQHSTVGRPITSQELEKTSVSGKR